MTHPQCSAGISVADWERVFQDACDEAGCAYDNEALLAAIADLKARAQPQAVTYCTASGPEYCLAKGACCPSCPLPRPQRVPQ